MRRTRDLPCVETLQWIALSLVALVTCGSCSTHRPPGNPSDGGPSPDVASAPTTEVAEAAAILGINCCSKDARSAGVCVGSAPPNCDDGNVCTDDSCNPASGCNACTQSDTCQAGACVGGPPATCTPLAPCLDAGACDPADSGPLTISGHVRDANNQPVVGVQLSLTGGTQALRFSDIAGGYAFHVYPGTYSLAVWGACSLAPQNLSINNLTANLVQDFAAGNGACITSTISHVNPQGAIFTISRCGSDLGITIAHIETLSSNAAALTRLEDIGYEISEPTRPTTIAGLPAIERQALLTISSEHAGDFQLLLLSTAIAIDNNVVRFESQIAPDASTDTINTFFNIARYFTPDTIPGLHGPPNPTVPLAPDAQPPT